MLRVSLEKELREQAKASAMTRTELLAIQQGKKLANITEEDKEILGRVGMATNIRIADEVKKEQKAVANNFHFCEKDRIFHISQIEELCKKYYLKFWPSFMYQGYIDPGLAGKIFKIEQDNCRYIHSYKHRPEAWVLAPKSSFKPQNRHGSSLFFIKFSKNYYYLLHKWGNDISIFRRLKSMVYELRVWKIFAFLALLLIMNGIFSPGLHAVDRSFSVLGGCIFAIVIVPMTWHFRINPNKGNYFKDYSSSNGRYTILDHPELIK